MRVLITGRGYDNPAEHSLGIFEWDQARALRDAGHDVCFAALDTRSVRARRPWGVRAFVLDGIPVWYSALPAGRAFGRVSLALEDKAAALLWERIDRDGWRPEVVHSHFGASLLPGAKERGVPRVYTEHDSGTNLACPPPEELARERETYALADRLLCVSRPLQSSIRRNTGAEAEVVPNIVDTACFSRPVPPASEGGGFRFAAVGSLIKRKGFDLLLDAMGALRQKGLCPKLTIIGQGEEEPALRERAGALGVSPQIEFMGFRPRNEIAEIFHGSDAFVLPSRRETFGVVYVEAMAAGLPVIASCCGGPEDFITENNGILIPVEDTEALSDAMEHMMLHRADFDSERIAAEVREKYSPEKVAAQLTAVYEEVLSC